MHTKKKIQKEKKQSTKEKNEIKERRTREIEMLKKGR